MNNLNKIAVLGAGSWGTALAILLARNGHQVQLWGRNRKKISAMKAAGHNCFFLPEHQFPDSLTVSSDLGEVLKQTDDLLVVVPSHAFRETLEAIKTFKPELKQIAWATKGIESKTQELLHQVVAEEFDVNIDMAAISGPTFAKEVADGLPTAVVVASNHPEYAQHFSQLLRNATFRPYVSRDITGVEVGGAAKNVIAIAAGIADGLGFGANSRSALITRGLSEIMRLADNLGGDSRTLMGLSGLGDLLLTCTDNQSRNRRLGLAIGNGLTVAQAKEQIQQVVEGVQAALLIHMLASQRGIEMPITEQVYLVLYENLSPEQAVRNLLSREYTSE